MNNQSKTGIPESEVNQRVEALLAKMSLDEKIGQLNQVSGADFSPGPKAVDVIRKVGAVAQCPPAIQRTAKNCGGGKPFGNPALVRAGRDSRLPHDFPYSPGNGRILGPGSGGTIASRGRP
jgi:hypothetical protein